MKSWIKFKYIRFNARGNTSFSIQGLGSFFRLIRSPVSSIFKHCNSMYILSLLFSSLLIVSCGAEDMWSRLHESGLGCRVLYSANGGTGGSVPVDETLYAPDGTVTVLGNPGYVALLGYTFADWNTQEDGLGLTYTEGDTFVLTGSDVILYARWIPNNTYAVSYSGNTSTGGSPPFDPLLYQYHQTVTVMGNTGNLVKTGNYFMGWNTDSGGTGTAYTQGQTFEMGVSNVILYAQWTAGPVYTVTYNANGGTGTAPDDSTNYINTQTETPADLYSQDMYLTAGILKRPGPV